jgi:hypothetical protein
MRQFMVIERFKDGRWDDVYARSHKQGRMLPDGLRYLKSWTNRERSLCFQLMETSQPDLFPLWFERWADLVDFELIPLD